jgi:hypothetical protein
MAIYQETYCLASNFPGFIALKDKLDLSIGLNNVEIPTTQRNNGKI